MIRALMITPLLLVTAAFAALYIAYGQVDPCRVLAVERARRTMGDASGVLEPWTRIETSQMSTAACSNGLLDSWGARLSRYVR
jgi:hypothetical protein